MTRNVYLEMSYRRGRALAGYLYLPRKDGDRAARSRKVAPGLVVDYAEDGRAIGIEITSPSTVSVEAINAVLAEMAQDPVDETELAPLLTE